MKLIYSKFVLLDIIPYLTSKVISSYIQLHNYL